MSSKSPLHIRTPLVYSPLLSARAGCHTYLKLENTQPSGSFKSRGVGALASASLAKFGPSAHLVCSSGGNAGLACAYAGSALGLRVTIFVPLPTKPDVIRRIESYGAQVVPGGEHWFEADQGARKFVEEQRDAVYVPPFDHPTVVEGNSTIIQEIAEQLEEHGASKLAGVCCSVGGGGLLSGILSGMKASGGRLEVPVLACETSGAASLRLSSRSSFATIPPSPKLERLEGISSIATTLGAIMVSQQVVDLHLSHLPGVASIVVEDERTVADVRSFVDDHAFFVEPACAVALAPSYYPEVLHAALPFVKFAPAGETPPKDAPSIVVVVCGGNTVTLERFLGWEKEFEGKGKGPTSIFFGARGIDVEL